MSDDATRTAVANTISMMVAIEKHVGEAIRAVRAATDTMRTAYGITAPERDVLVLMAIEQRLRAARQAVSAAADGAD